MTQRHFLLTLVTGIAIALGSSAAIAAVSSKALANPLAQYKTYVLQNSKKLISDTRSFVAAIQAGDLSLAKKLYPTTRLSYERIEPIAELFEDLDGDIDSRADDHELAEQSPDFWGFHRIEYGLWVEEDPKKMIPQANKLMKDVTELQKRLTSLTFPPEKVVGGAAALMEEIVEGKISGEENRYSHTDLYDFQANVEGAHKINELLRPLITKVDRKFVDKTDANFSAVFKTLDKYRTANGGFENYDKLTAADRQFLAGRVNLLAEDLSKLRGMLGLN